MKKIVVITALFFSVSMADSYLLVKKGWQLIGSSVPLSDMSKFKSQNVEQVWTFDAKTQKWLGYSPDTTIQNKINTKGIKTLHSLKNWHGFWLKSKKDWTLTFESKKLTSEPSSSKDADSIELKKGWNLISLPVDTVVSADIFKGMTVWKYNDKHWETSSSSGAEESFPKIGHISNADGLWVKADADKTLSVMKEASKLHSFSSRDEVKKYIKEMAKLNNRPYWGIMPAYTRRAIPLAQPTTAEDATLSATPNATSNASGTNVQEQGVDEADILKHNGKNIFYLGKSEKGLHDHINISTFSKLTTSSKVELGRVTLAGQNISSFYLVKDKLVVLSTKINGKTYVDRGEDVAIYDGGGTQELITIFNVANIDNVQKVAEYKVDGTLDNSRIIGDNLYIISSFYPKYKTTYPKIDVTPSETCKEYLSGHANYDETNPSKYVECYNIKEENGRYFRYDYKHANIEMTQLLPKIEGNNGSAKEMVLANRLYASAKAKQSLNITTISKFSIATPSYLKSTSFLGQHAVTYASTDSLYLLSYAYPYYYDFNNYKERSMLYKFKFDEDLSYKAVGSVYGKAINQFSLSEKDEVLRIATTEGFSWGENGTHNRLYTLKEKSGLLEIEGTLSGLGKEGESIKSVRFMGNRAYLVTFKTTDPLYTIDLSDPKAPKKMGELKVDGYSAYLHPIGETKLLGVGRDTDTEGRRKGVKIELFDVSDFAHPSSLDSIVLADGTSSELEYNHKALAYRANDNLFSFPYQHYMDGKTENRLGIYQVTGDALKSYEGLLSSSERWGQHRGLIFDQNGKTYVSFFSDDSVLTKALKEQ